MDYFRKTFSNVTNPMKMVPSPSLPNLKVQRLNVMNKLSSMKGSCIAVNSNDGTEQQDTEQPPPEHLERRTIDSKHISTVSSLVATKSDDELAKSSKAKESQCNNFGLYALKFHRNLATHANSMYVNFKKDIGKRSKVTSKSVDETTVHQNESPELYSAARSNRTKHEHFEPCHQRTHQNGAKYDNEFDDYGNVNVWNNNSNRFQRNRTIKHNSENVVNGPNARAPVRPRRIKPIAPKANSVPAASVTDRRVNAYERSQSIDSFDSDQNVMNI